MSEPEAIIDEVALNAVSQGVSGYISSMHAAIDAVMSDIRANLNDWNDEDYDDLIASFYSLTEDLDGIESGTYELIKIVNEKLAAISRLRKMKIGE